MEKSKIKTNQHTDEVGDGEDDAIAEPPKSKIAKLRSQSDEYDIDLTLNTSYTTKEFTHELKTNWSAKQEECIEHSTNGVKVYGEPFQICLLPELLQSKPSCKQLVNEMVQKVKWSRKQMDLYEFYQSTDLSNMAQCKLLTGFLQMLRRTVRPWLEKVTNLKLDYVSASCSMYTCGDYLLVHDDLLKDRQIAFVYYLSPWDGAEQWGEQQGGCLEIFNSDEQCFPQFPVQHKISPKNNQFAFFKVGARSFHQVGEVTNFDYPRLTINGWFHGASNDDLAPDISGPFSHLNFIPAQETNESLELVLNELYMNPHTREAIQTRIEEYSEISLYEFFRREIFVLALEQLTTDTTLKWRIQGPANIQNYEILELNTASKTVAQLISIFTSPQMFELLRNYTDLDLAGPGAKTPTCSLELQRWSHGNYTVLGDGAMCVENTLDLTYHLNAQGGAATITYLHPDNSEEEDERHIDYDSGDDDSVLLTIMPVDNALNIVYRCEGTTKFVKYVSRNTPLLKGPVFVISCSYKE